MHRLVGLGSLPHCPNLVAVCRLVEVGNLKLTGDSLAGLVEVGNLKLTGDNLAGLVEVGILQNNQYIRY